MNILKNEIPKDIKPNTWVGVDTEFFGMNGKRLHRPSGKFACLTIALNDPDNTVLFIDQEELIVPALASIEQCVWCFQKAMFDIIQLRRYATIKPRKRIWDIMLIERIMFAGYYEKYNMQAIVRHWLHEKVEKEARELFEKATTMTDEMIEYACLDPLYTVRVAQAQRKAINKDEFQIWTDIDGAVMWPYLEFRGFAIDVEKWKQLAEANTARYKEVDTHLSINPRSPDQVLPYLKKNGFKNLKATGEDELWKAIIKYPDTIAARDARLILESRKYQRRASTYGEKFLNDVEYDDGVPVIICEYDPNKAETGRSASSGPNMQNIPVRDTKEFRECFVARPGHKLIIADYAAQEPRITAYYSQDKCLMEWFNTGKDPYIEIAKIMFNENITKHDPRRAKIKAVLLGISYGMSKYGLARQEDITVEEADRLLNDVLQILSGVRAYIQKQSQNINHIKTLENRKLNVNPYDNQHERNAVNGPTQGTASAMKKKSLIRMYREWKPEWGVFGVVGECHDEIIIDASEEFVGEIEPWAKNIMEDEANKMIPDRSVRFVVDTHVGTTWAEK